MKLRVARTQLVKVVTEEEAGQDHLAQTKAGAKGREEADWDDSKSVEEDDGKRRVDEAEIENRLGQGTDGKGRHDHVGRQPL